MPFPDQLVGYDTSVKNINAAFNQLERIGPSLSYQLNCLSGFTISDPFDIEHVYKTNCMVKDCPFEEIMAADAWSIIINSLLIQGKENKSTSFRKAAIFAINARLELYDDFRFPKIGTEI